MKFLNRFNSTLAAFGNSDWLAMRLLAVVAICCGGVSECFAQQPLPVTFLVNQKSLSRALSQQEKLPIGFKYADADSDGKISRPEFRKYVRPRLKDIDLPFAKIFRELDEDRDGSLSEEEFEPRNEVIQKYVEELFPAVEIADDPGSGYKLFEGLEKPIDDSLAYSAVYHRTLEITETSSAQIDLESIPRLYRGRYPPVRSDNAQSTLEDACRATVVLGGGKEDEDFFTGGGVIVSPDGLLLTNWHVAQSINDGLVAILSDGRAFKVSKVLAANPDRDVALLKLDGSDFPYVSVANTTPRMAANISAVHHSENRFYTFDGGYVKRYPKIQEHSWMEVSVPFAPGGSGCGIFDDKFQLVGLICFISIGDGPSMASEPMDEPSEDPDSLPEKPAYLEMSNIVVRLAVPLEAIRALWVE